MESIEERTAAGKALRKTVPRSSQADFKRDPSLDPVDLLLSQEKGRIESLIPVRRERMAESAFAFYRAGALLMATDLAPTPRTGLLVQCSGDAHVSNFGWYGSPERVLVFDANDFDETMVAAWEWDLKRLVASFVIASQDNGFKTKKQRKAASAASNAYRDAMNGFASEAILDTWYAHVNADDILEQLRKEGRSKDGHEVQKAVKKASRKNSNHVLGKIGEQVDGHWRAAPFDGLSCGSWRCQEERPQDLRALRRLSTACHPDARKQIPCRGCRPQGRRGRERWHEVFHRDARREHT